jgi:hypothetical protein
MRYGRNIPLQSEHRVVQWVVLTHNIYLINSDGSGRDRHWCDRGIFQVAFGIPNHIRGVPDPTGPNSIRGSEVELCWSILCAQVTDHSLHVYPTPLLVILPWIALNTG